MDEHVPLTFYTVTNARYFAGTVAAISSIRTFHPKQEIWVFAETREHLTPLQIAHLCSVRNVNFVSPESLFIGAIHEAWQLKAHAAHFLAARCTGVLVQVDSDVVICSCLDDLVLEVHSRRVPAGGRDGGGVRYDRMEYLPYISLCGIDSEPDCWSNSNYISTSVLFLPLPASAELLRLWSLAVDRAEWGPPQRESKEYAGYSDQGVLNAILHFKGVLPLVLDNDTLSEHWTHGDVALEFREGAFWNGMRHQRALHSVGHAPKFWTSEYATFVEERGTLTQVYSYWLYQLFDGPAGLLQTNSQKQLQERCFDLFPAATHDLLKEYLCRRRGDLKSIVRNYGRLCGGPGDFSYYKVRSSANLLCSCAFDGYLDEEGDIHYLYSAVKRMQSYRLLGGTADTVIFANARALEHFSTRSLAEICDLNSIKIVLGSKSDLQALFSAQGIDIDCVRASCEAWVPIGQTKGRYAEALTKDYNLLAAVEIYIGRLLLVEEFLRRAGYERCALVDADDGRYEFLTEDVPNGCHVDDIWKFDEYTDFVFQETITGEEEAHQVSLEGLIELFGLRPRQKLLPMFQASLQWFQGTYAAFSAMTARFVDEMKRCCLLGYYPADELVLTAVILDHKLWPDFGISAGHSLRRQIEVANGLTEPWCLPTYLKEGENKYKRLWLTPPCNRKRYAVCIAAFNDPAESSSRKYSRAACERIEAYRKLMEGRMDVHLYTDDRTVSLPSGCYVHITSPEELTAEWDSRATFEGIVSIHHEACADRLRHKEPSFIKEPRYSLGMLAKIVAVEATLKHGYDGVLSADADGVQFSKETIGCLGRRHIDALWTVLERHPMLTYIVGTATNDSFHTWLSILRRISGLPVNNEGPLDWIWGPCWAIEAQFAERFFLQARRVFKRMLDERIAFHDEHLLNCTYNLSAFEDNPLRGIRDLGDAVLVGYREMSDQCLLRYKRWATGEKHTGRRQRELLWYAHDEFDYEY